MGDVGVKRGQRKLWRAVADAAMKVALSSNHAEEYMAGIEFSRAMDALLATAEHKR